MSTAQISKYGLNFDPEVYSDLAIELAFVKAKGKIKGMFGEYGNGLFFHVKEAQKLLWPQEDHHRWSDLITQTMCDNEITVLIGCSDCVVGETRILNPLTGEQPTIQELCESRTAPVVQTIYGPEQAEIPFKKGVAEVFEVRLANGNRFTATAGHSVLCENGFVRVGDLTVGQPLFSYEESRLPSISGHAPSIQLRGVPGFQKTTGDSQDRYSSYSHPYGAQPQIAIAGAQSFSPLPTCAQERNSRKSYLDVLERKPSRNRWYLHASRHAISGSVFLDGFLPTSCRFPRAEQIPSRDSLSFQPRGQSPSMNSLRKSYEEPFSGFDHKRLSLLTSRGMVSRTKVVSIRKTGTREFYDITVPNAAHYFAEGAIHHNSCKTWSMVKFLLVDYWCSPENTLWLVSTTEGRGSELRIYGCIKDLFNDARTRYEWLAGNPVDYIKTITTAQVDSEGIEARSLRRGIIVVPCKTGGVVSGLAPYIGIKAPRLRHAGDEVPAMADSFLNAYANWYGKEDFKGIMSGNFMEMDDPLGIAAEPVGGWDAFSDTGKTQTWRSKFYDAAVLALDGRDSPNFDFPSPFGIPKFKYMIGQKKLDGVAKSKGTDSWEWYSQCIGKPVKGLDIWRVLTKEFCALHKALEEVIWKGEEPLQLYSLDPAYGGGDRCVGRHLELGVAVDGRQILFLHPPEVIPIKLGTPIDPEGQIALFIKARLDALSVKPQNCFYDSFGRGTLGFEFAKLFGANCPVPVDSGAMPTSRPVRFDLFVEDQDTARRLKRCSEHYVKFVTEMYFSVREAIDSEQVRGLDKETMREGCSRKFTRHAGNNKIEIETKDDYKERNRGMSPDYFDNLAIGVEGARQRGFRIERIGGEIIAKTKPDWLDKALDERAELLKSRELSAA